VAEQIAAARLPVAYGAGPGLDGQNPALWAVWTASPVGLPPQGRRRGLWASYGHPVRPCLSPCPGPRRCRRCLPRPCRLSVPCLPLPGAVGHARGLGRSRLPVGAGCRLTLPAQRSRCARPNRLIWLPRDVRNKLDYLRGAGESYSDVILRMAVTDERAHQARE
jgi:hypothetical protein